jgi:membrane-associated phospholipid phosphatase
MRKFTTIILLFSFFALFPMKNYAQNTDYKLLKSIYNSSSGLKNYSAFISKTTKITAISVPVIMGSVALIRNNDTLLKDAIYVGASIGLNTALTYGFKYSINRPRPYETHLDLVVDPEFYESSASFPSGHTSVAFATATALSLKYRNWYVIAPAYIWAGSVGYSRMNLGVHYPSDVLAGAVIGAGSAYLTYKINEWFWQKQNNKKLLVIQSYL